ncbi:hypothetical protein [Primorskyibacter flagellatus]|uniref:hypothetical protein n=1 Tax=Primorskyibacter flagellatus TaxID=1387277 RepID=UPI003A91C2A7
MPTGGAIVWYIEPQGFALQSLMIGAHQLKDGSTYESEAMWQMPDGVVHYEVILLSRVGNDVERERVERLKQLAELQQPDAAP